MYLQTTSAQAAPTPGSSRLTIAGCCAGCCGFFAVLIRRRWLRGASLKSVRSSHGALPRPAASPPTAAPPPPARGSGECSTASWSRSLSPPAEFSRRMPSLPSLPAAAGAGSGRCRSAEPPLVVLGRMRAGQKPAAPARGGRPCSLERFSGLELRPAGEARASSFAALAQMTSPTLSASVLYSSVLIRNEIPFVSRLWRTKREPA